MNNLTILCLAGFCLSANADQTNQISLTNQVSQTNQTNKIQQAKRPVVAKPKAIIQPAAPALPASYVSRLNWINTRRATLQQQLKAIAKAREPETTRMTLSQEAGVPFDYKGYRGRQAERDRQSNAINQELNKLKLDEFNLREFYHIGK